MNIIYDWILFGIMQRDKACLMPTGCDIWDIPVGQKACLLPLIKKMITRRENMIWG